MLLNEIKNVSAPVNAKLIVEQVDAVIMTELWGGMSSLVGAAKDKMANAKQSIANTYNQGEVQSLLRQYDAYKSKLVDLIKKYPHAFGGGMDAAPEQRQSAPDNPRGDERRAPTLQNRPSPQDLRSPLDHPWRIHPESVELSGEILNELLGGLGALFGAAKDKAKEVKQRVGGTYVRGEALSLLKKMVDVAKALKEKGHKVTPQQMQEYSKLRRMVG